MVSNSVSPAGDRASAAADRPAADLFHLDALRREAQVVFGGAGTGIKDAAIDAARHPGETATKVGLSVLLGAGLALAQGRAGFARVGAEVVGMAMGTSFGIDALGRAGSVCRAMADAWHSDQNLEADKAVVAGALGQFVFDSAIMSVGGIAGAKIGRVPSFYMGAHGGIDRLRGVSMLADQARLREQMLVYHPGTAYHQDRVGDMSLLIAKQMKLPPASVETAYFAGRLHDTGKLNTPLEILDFAGAQLDPVQRAVIDRHATDSGIILQAQVDYPARLAQVPSVTQFHHERIDGQGAPNRVSGVDIPIEARVNSVADVFDALSHQRSYKDPTPVDGLLDVMQRGRGTQFDPAAVDALMKVPADKAVKLMFSEGPHAPDAYVVAPFKGVTLGDLLKAASGKYPYSDGPVSSSLTTRFNNFYGPAHLNDFQLPASAYAYRLTKAHL